MSYQILANQSYEASGAEGLSGQRKETGFPPLLTRFLRQPLPAN